MNLEHLHLKWTDLTLTPKPHLFIGYICCLTLPGRAQSWKPLACRYLKSGARTGAWLPKKTCWEPWKWNVNMIKRWNRNTQTLSEVFGTHRNFSDLCQLDMCTPRVHLSLSRLPDFRRFLTSSDEFQELRTTNEKGPGMQAPCCAPVRAPKTNEIHAPVRTRVRTPVRAPVLDTRWPRL